MSDLCPFCTPTRTPVLANEYGYAIPDKYPVSPGHTLIIPHRHTAGFFDLKPAERRGLFDLVDKARALLDSQHRPDGYNIGVNIGKVAGQTVMHVHIHLIPRYAGDTPHPRGGVRGVIPDKQSY